MAKPQSCACSGPAPRRAAAPAWPVLSVTVLQDLLAATALARNSFPTHAALPNHLLPALKYQQTYSSAHSRHKAVAVLGHGRSSTMGLHRICEQHAALKSPIAPAPPTHTVLLQLHYRSPRLANPFEPPSTQISPVFLLKKGLIQHYLHLHSASNFTDPANSS